MHYFKNVDLASRYNISESTVRNWVKLSKQGKLDLALASYKGKSYVANVATNIRTIERLVETNKKYRNSLSAKSVTPRPEFYKVFSQTQIYDIVRSIEIHHEIPRQYNYFDGGAGEWDVYVNNLGIENTPNLLNRTVELLAETQGYLDKRLAPYKRINIVDIGVGNALPVKELLTRLLEQGVFGRYIAIDISPEMLQIAERNIKKWFGGRVTFESHQMDITHERFANILARDYLAEDARSTANLMLCLGGTPDNFRNPDDTFRTINESMNPNDLLIYTNKLETDDMRPEWFDYDAVPGELTLAARHRLVFDLLNVDKSFYDVEVGFDKITHQRYAQTQLKVALTIEFNFEDGQRVIELEKGDAILLWRSWQMTAKNIAEQFDRTGFSVLHSSLTEDQEYILTVSKVKRGS